jgi:Uma2 family endonuclease
LLEGPISKNGCHGAPAVIIEVLSPSSALKDFNEKFNLYQKHEVREYWIVDPGNQTVHVYALQDGSYAIRHLYTEQEAIHSVIFKELQVPMNRLFSLE